MKKVIIFESVKGAGKTTLLDALSKVVFDAVVLAEEITLKPIKHTEEKGVIVSHYKSVIGEIENSEGLYFLLDRFHYTKWPVIDYKKDYFDEVESLLLEKFDVSFVFLKINESQILPRLLHTQNDRDRSGWKLNYDGISIDEEAKKDIDWQSFFLLHQYVDTKIQNKMILDTTELQLNLGNLESYIRQIKEKLHL